MVRADSRWRNDRQQDVRWVSRVVVNRLAGAARTGVIADRVARVHVSVEPREIAAADLHPDPVTGFEEV